MKANSEMLCVLRNPKPQMNALSASAWNLMTHANNINLKKIDIYPLMNYIVQLLGQTKL